MTDQNLGKYERFLKQLPVMPDVAAKVMSMAEEASDISFHELEDIIKVDAGLTTKILKVANSALYARQREIKSLQMAITLLGLKNIRSLVLLVTASNLMPKAQSTSFYQQFWQHSIYSAFLAKHLALRTNLKDLGEDAFLGGLLHDIGEVALFNADKDNYRQIIESAASTPSSLEELELERFGCDHRELGASILKKWNFPDVYVDIAREHESLNITSRYKSVIIVVSVADILTQILGFSPNRGDGEDLLGKFVAYTTLSEQDVDYYKNSFVADLKEDPLFQECQNLFQLKA
jgi:putative nucleotidyltransferase with HDIG domain